MFRLALLAQLSLTAAIDAGDCAFVGIYGEKDDFALVLLEDAAGEKLSLTDKLGEDFKVSPVAEAQGEFKRGSVLKKKDFSGASFVAPAALSLFKGPPEAPTVLCSIKMEGKGASTERRLEEVMMDFGEVDNAQYMGAMQGEKEWLLEQILNRENWETRSAHFRQLQGFSVAHNHGNHSKMSTTMMTTMMNTTMMMTTTMEETTMMTTTDDHDHEHIEIEGCIGFTSASADAMIADDKVVMAMKTAIASLLDGVMASQITELNLMKGMCARRLASERQLQSEEAVTANYKIELPPSAAQVAQAAQATLTDATVAQVQEAIATELESASLSYNVTVTTVTAPTVDMPGPDTTMKPSSGAYGHSILGLLLCVGAM